MGGLDPVRLITVKRDGGQLTPAEIRQLIDAYTDGQVPDYQISAFLMAVFLRGMDGAETFALAEAMLNSGTIVDLSDVPGVKVDKHSTGGVGDKLSLILAPLVASAGVPVPMISGRGLGHTGGTLDKLESIPGFRTRLTLDEYHEQLRRLGVVMIGQTEEIAPADKKLYALRDVTSTVESVPLIAASIMSKKLAEGIDALVLDVKVGKGAFMPDALMARRLAETLVDIGEHFGTRSVALLTEMNDPLGYAVGNWCEMEEAIRCLQGENVPEVTELTLALGSEMLVLGEVASDLVTARETLQSLLESGAAFEVFSRMVAAQGGDTKVVQNPHLMGESAVTTEVLASSSHDGYIASIDALAIGQAATRLGAGRMRVDDNVDPLAGITLCRKRGDRVQPGDCLARLHTRSSDLAEPFLISVRDAFVTGDKAPAPRQVVIDRLVEGRWNSAVN
jgi:pyrimidine-nucleoside phosphorylase